MIDCKHLAVGWMAAALTTALARRLVDAGLLERSEYEGAFADSRVFLSSLERTTGPHPIVDEAAKLLRQMHMEALRPAGAPH